MADGLRDPALDDMTSEEVAILMGHMGEKLGDTVGGFIPLNRKAKVGAQAKWGVDRGAKVENMDLIDLSNLKEIYSDKVQKKSENFFFKLLGLK